MIKRLRLLARNYVRSKNHQWFYDAWNTWKQNKWMGVTCHKNPLDLWIYQELLFKLKPDLIIECGTFAGGSALFLAHMCDLIGKGKIVTVDIEDKPRPEHPRIQYVHGSSTSSNTANLLGLLALRYETILVILDSDHTQSHVAKEMEIYAPLVTVGSYLIVEDGNINGHPVFKEYGPGPYEAIQEFLPKHPEFEIDRECERLQMTFNPSGYLKKIR